MSCVCIFGDVSNKVHIVGNSFQPILPITDCISEPMKKTEQEEHTRQDEVKHPPTPPSTFTSMTDMIGVLNKLEGSLCEER